MRALIKNTVVKEQIISKTVLNWRSFNHTNRSTNFISEF